MSIPHDLNIQKAQDKWDTEDVSRVRDVSWLAFDDIVNYIHTDLEKGRPLPQRVSEVLSSLEDRNDLREPLLLVGI